MSSKLVERATQGVWNQKLLPQLFALADKSVEPEIWIPLALPMIASQAKGLVVGFAQGIKGQWRTLAQTNPLPKLPTAWLADVLDTETGGRQDGWLAAPVESPVDEGYILVGFTDQINSAVELLKPFDATAAALGLVLSHSGRLSRLVNRAERLQALLDVTIKWNKTHNTESLLHEIAKTSTRLLQAERATIFLIDRARNQLVGKPALGVKGGELLIPIDAGVVGRAIRTGSPQRVDSDVASEQAMVNRDVDAQLHYQTRSLICVPIRDTSGRNIGAFEIINKINGNFDDDDEEALLELAAHASTAIQNSKHVEQLVASKKHVADQAQNQVQWIGNSPSMQRIKSTIERVADTDLAILITGENGTGKEVAAQMIHYLSSRRDQVLVAVNCAAIAESLLESELFGHEKGAFTDANQTHIGKFELADGGTLFLDEIGDMSLGGQAKLLRVLEEKIVVRVGGSTPIPTNARVIAATNQNLAQLVREKKFREDLFFRLNVVSLEMPALRDRGDDVIALATHFLSFFAGKARRKAPELTPAAEKRLRAHVWPGNVRELRNMMERLAYLSTDSKIDANDLPFVDSPRQDFNAGNEPLDGTLADATDRFQLKFIEQHIQEARGNMTEAARKMGLHRSNLYRKMKQLGMDTDEV
jgi:Nif-specific regulatory protein